MARWQRLIWILATLLWLMLVYQLGRKLLGGSWTPEQIGLALFSFFTTVLLGIYVSLNGKLSFLAGQFEQFQMRMGTVETRMTAMETRIGAVETRMAGVERALEGLIVEVRALRRRG